MRASDVILMLEELIEAVGDVEVVFSNQVGCPVPSAEEPEPEPVNRVFGRNGNRQ